MEGRPSYRVYGPADLRSIAPATFRTAAPPIKRGFSGLGLVTIIVVFIGGATFAAQHYVDRKLAQNASSRAAAARDTGPGATPFSLSLTGPTSAGTANNPNTTATSPTPVPTVAVGTSKVASAESALLGSKQRRKLIFRPRSVTAIAGPGATPSTDGLPGVPGFVPVIPPPLSQPTTTAAPAPPPPPPPPTTSTSAGAQVPANPYPE